MGRGNGAERSGELLADLARKFPEPPPELGLSPDIKTLDGGTELWRIYFQGGRHPTTWSFFRSFGPTGSRFDHQAPSAPERRILYAAEEIHTALAEVFQQTRMIDRLSRSPWLVGFRLRRPVELLDLTGTWPTRAGASMALSSGPRPRAQRWSRVIYESYPDIEGLCYPSSMHANRPAVALCERSEDVLPPRPTFHRPLSDPALLDVLKKAASGFGYELI